MADLSRLRRSLPWAPRPPGPEPGPGTDAEEKARTDTGEGRDQVEEPGWSDPVAGATARAIPVPERDALEPRRTMERHFCRDCMPARPHDPEVMTATAVGLLGALVAVWSVLIGAALMAIGLVRVVLRVGGRFRRRRDPNRQSTALFVDPRVSSLAMTETMTGSIQLDDQHRYQEEVTEVRGVIAVKAAWARSHTTRISRHRHRHRIPDSHDLEIASGSLVVCGPARLELCSTDVGHLAHPTTVSLRPRTGDHPVLRTPDGRGDPRWEFDLAYEINPPAAGWQLPVWIVPAISPGSDQRALDIEVQWRTRDPAGTEAGETALESKSIKKISISVPTAWGEMTGHSGAELVSFGQPGERRRIEWRQPKIERTDQGRCHLSVSFEYRIKPTDTVTGELDMGFHRTLSGASRVQVHAAGGARRQDGARCAVETRVKVGFDLSLAGARYQDVRAVPDPVKDSDQLRREHQTFHNVVPDPHTVANLTNILSREGYYLKRVVENPPQPGRSAGVLNRFWDIAGRKYNGVHPIDFHLVLTGEEIELGATGVPTTTVRLAVRGTYASDEMERQIVLEQELLWQRIVSGLAGTETGADGGQPRSSDEPIETASTEVARLRNVALSLIQRIESGQQDGDITAALASELLGRIGEEFELDDR